MELGNVVGDSVGAVDSPVGARGTWHSESKKVCTTSFLGLPNRKLDHPHYFENVMGQPVNQVKIDHFHLRCFPSLRRYLACRSMFIPIT